MTTTISPYYSPNTLSLPLYISTPLTLFVAISVIYFIVYLRHKKLLSPLAARKIIHIATGPAYVGFWLVFPQFPHNYSIKSISISTTNNLFNNPSYSPLFCSIIPIILTLYFILTGLSIIPDKKLIETVSRSNSPRELIQGPSIYGLVQIFSTLFYFTSNPTGIIAIVLLAFGDGFADLIGRKYGEKTGKIPYNKNKSLIGTLSFIFTGFLSCFCIIKFYQLFGFFIEFNNWNLFLTVVISAIVESLPIQEYDNLTIFLTVCFCGKLFWE
jgi:dolichol kinase